MQRLTTSPTTSCGRSGRRCAPTETARGARRWNDGNVLAVGLRLTTAATAAEMLDVFLPTDVDEEEERPQVAAVEPAPPTGS